MVWKEKGIDEILKYANYSSDWLETKQKKVKEMLMTAQMKQYQRNGDTQFGMSRIQGQ